MSNYTNCITLEQMLWLDLFDDLPYKNIKDILELDGDTDFEVEIVDIPNNHNVCPTWCTTSFNFILNINVSQGSLPIMVDKHFTVTKAYSGSSPMALFIMEYLIIEEEEEEEEEN